VRSTLVLITVALAGCGSDPTPAPVAHFDAAAAPARPPEPKPGRVVYDLLANRPLASVHVADNLILDGGTADFWKWIDGGWKSNWSPMERDGDRQVALVQGIAGVVRFPVDTEDPNADLRVSFSLRPAVPRQALSLFLNEKPIANLQIDDGYKSYEVTLPRARLVAGDNTLRFHFRGAGTLAGKHTAAAFEKIAIGPKGAREPAAVPKLGSAYGVSGEARRAVSSPMDGRFSWYLSIPPSTKLNFWYGTQAPPAGVSFAIRATSDGKPTKELWTAPATSGWTRASVDLAPIAGETVRLDLVVKGGGAFGEPQIVADAKPVAREKSKAAEHVLVWMVDTLRADRLTAWNDKTITKTPGFDQLAREATRFARTTVQGNYSLPSHTTLLTGVLPSVHKMYEDKDRLDEKLPIASQVFQRAGFATAIFSSNGYVSDKWGFKKGWDGYRNFIREDKPNSADQVWKAAKPWLDEQVKAGKRTFMYLATVDPHVAYNPPERFLKDYWPKPYKGPIKPIKTSEQLYQIKVNKLKLTDEDKRYLEALYNAEVTQNDTTFVQVVADLKQMGIYDKTAIVLISDHGDEFFDHGSVGHGHSLYQELVDVPLLVRFPPLFPEAKVVRDDVEVMDLYSTLFDVAGVDPNSEAQGDSLVPLATDDGPRMDRPAESFHDGAIRSLRLGKWKFLTWAGRVQLFDLDADPHEKKDLSADHPIALRYVRNVFAYLHAYNEKWHKTRWGVASDLKPAFADEIGM
jgi:arylsulfatase A-like enzyme